MLRSLIGYSIRQPLVVIVLALILLCYAILEIGRAGLDIFPEFSPKQVVIQTEASGFSTQQVEQQVTHPIEMALTGLNDLQMLRSQSLQGLSVVIATFSETSDIYRNRQLIAERLNSVAAKLPPTISAPHAVPLSSSSATLLTIGIEAAHLSELELRDLVVTVIAPQLLAVPGVADLNVFGGAIRQLQIQPQAAAIRRYDVSLQQVTAAARSAIQQLGLGFIENSNQRFSVTADTQQQMIERLQAVALQPASGKLLSLSDLARVDYAAAPAISAASIAARPGIVIMVIGQYNANTLSVSKRLNQVLDTLHHSLAQRNITLHSHLFRPADYIETSLTNLLGHLLIGTVFVVVIILLFLFNLRTALISTLAIPLSLCAAALVLIKAGVNLNIMVLGGIAIALGEVVDDAIIDTENIFRRLNQQRQFNQQPLSQHKLRQVILDASLEVRSSVVYATFIVSLVFVPLLTLSGIAGRLYAPLGMAYILAILMSLLVALSVTPALAVCLLKQPARQDGSPLLDWLKKIYASALQVMIRHAWFAIVISLLTVILGICAIPALKQAFIPQLREGHLILHSSLHPGASLQESIRAGNRISRALLDISGIESVSQWAGRAEQGADTYGSHYSEFEIRLYPAGGRQQQLIEEAIRAVLNRFPGIRYELNTFLTERVNETISGYSAPLAINIYGDDLAQLDLKAGQIASRLRQMSGINSVRIQSPTGAPQLYITLNNAQLRHKSITTQQLLETIQSATSGLLVGQFYQRNYPVQIRVRLQAEQTGDAHDRRSDGMQVDDIATLPIRSATGQWYRVSDVASIRQSEGRYNILHRNGKRLQTITATVADRDLTQLGRQLQQDLQQNIQLNPDMHFELTGAAFEQSESKRQLISDALLAGAGVLLLIYLAIGHFKQVLITLLNLPFSLIGGILAALLTDIPVSIGSMVGFITLFGITVRNSIMLVSHYQYLIQVERQLWTPETLVRGAQERLPSILMTALVTACAMLPIAIESDNPGLEILGPMAVIIIGGLFSSTLLNLFLLPAILYRFGNPQPAKFGLPR